MTRTSKEMDKDGILSMLQELSDELERMDEPSELFVVGGAAMSLAYNRHRSTSDIDAVFDPKDAVKIAAANVAEPNGLEDDWVNNAVAGFLPGNDDSSEVVFETEYLLVRVASPEYMLAMKTLAGREEQDKTDAALLFNRLGLESSEDIERILTSYYPPRLIEARHQYICMEIAELALSMR